MNLISKTSSKIILIRGKNFSSEFRLNSILKKLRSRSENIDSVICSEIFFVLLKKDLISIKKNELESLNSILNSSLDQDYPKNNSFVIVPRQGTQTPWSSKAQDIFKNCRINFVERVERGFLYSISSKLLLTSDQLRNLGEILADRMTQSVIFQPEEANSIFSKVDPSTYDSVPLMKDGKSSLNEANENLGLALSDFEIDYLFSEYSKQSLDPTDVELMMFSQANSEHCRHKIFNSRWKINGEVQPLSLFEMIKNTHKVNKKGVLSAYKDNAAVLEGFEVDRFYPDTKTNIYKTHKEANHIVTKVETHNHPTAISPFSGASTGSGGEIRDEGSTGRGAKPKAGLCGFSVSNLRIPDMKESWEIDQSSPNRIATPLEIMIEAPLGAAAFNNEFGRPNTLGYFRSFEMQDESSENSQIYGYHKPIMLAGGLGNIKNSHIHKAKVPIGSKLIVLGGPSMLIGLGGGSASSLSSGSGDEDLDFASVQRENPEMERRCQEVLDRCWQMGLSNPILFIHDVGAGGLSNAVPELLKDIGHGGKVYLRKIPSAEPGMSPLEIWCNESQERYVIAVSEKDLKQFVLFCERERCPFSVIGEVTETNELEVYDQDFKNSPVKLPLDLLFGKFPQLERAFNTVPKAYKDINLNHLDIESLLPKILRHPTVASKNFLITIGDRSVTGLICRDQLVGPWQVPVSDNAISLSSFNELKGEAMSIGEKSPCSILDASSAAKMAVAESVTNILSAGVRRISDIKLSANWMGSPGRLNGDQDLYQAVNAVGMELCPAWKMTIPVGKDSLSMATDWVDDEGRASSVIAPLSLVISAFSPIKDVNIAVTPQLVSEDSTELIFIDLAKNNTRMGGSITSQIENILSGIPPNVECIKEMPQFVECFYKLLSKKKILACHDRSDGGLLVSLLEMAFAGRLGVDLEITSICNSKEDFIHKLFNEELGIIIQIRREDLNEVLNTFSICGLKNYIHHLGTLNSQKKLRILENKKVKHEWELSTLLKSWSLVSYKIQSLRDNPSTAEKEYLYDVNTHRLGLNTNVDFEVPKKMKRRQKKPRIAILRDQGVNGQVEMAAAFDSVGFKCIDLHMTDLINRKRNLNEFRGLVACGGFSYGDVLGGGGGWAKSILFNRNLKKDFEEFFSREDIFALGVCNGCQMIANLSDLIIGSEGWPRFEKNISEKFESRYILTKIKESSSIFFRGMEDSVIAIPVAHGEGRISSTNEHAKNLIGRNLVPLVYVDDNGIETESYPQNPNGSSQGIAGVTNKSGNVTILMPHPERAFLMAQNSWQTEDKNRYGPWINFFSNARDFID